MAKILIVEDDKELNNLISNYLKDNNYLVKSCFNGIEALKELENEKVD